MTSTIYVRLLEEAVDVYRPVAADQDGGCFKLIGPMPADERWEFPPGALVKVATKQLSSGPALVAVEEVSG